MNAPFKTASDIAVNRRQVVVAAAAGGALLVGCSPADLMSVGAKADVGAFGPFIRIAPDGAVTVISKHIEFGQGNHAGLAAIVAEELDADWTRVGFEHAPANAKLYANGRSGVQLTGGSSAISNSWEQLRKAGAAARAMLVQAAAARWGVAADQIAVKDGVVSHGARRAGFGELLADAAKIEPPADPVLKDPKAFTLIGTDRVRRKDSVQKSNGTARYTLDVQDKGLLTALVAHPPRFGARVKSFDAAQALKVKGVAAVVEVETGVAVLADGFWAAKLGRDALRVVWDEAEAEKRGSDQILSEFKALAQDGGQGGAQGEVEWTAFDTKGDAAAAFSGSAPQGAGAGDFEATYDFPYLAHATMEPMNCVVRLDGRKVRLAFGSQGQTLDQLNAAKVIGTLPGSVEIETLFAGGSFGRRANFASDYVTEAVRVAKAAAKADKRLKGRPVKLVWTREDDMASGYFRPLVVHALKVRTGPDGALAAWRHRIVSQSIMKDSPVSVGDLDTTAVEGTQGSPYLKAATVVDAAVALPEVGVPVLWWRSVGATHTAMVMEHTIDQLARRAGADPVAYRRALYEKAGARRHLAVLNLAAEKAGWGGPITDGWARGVAVHESFGSVVAQVAEVTLRGDEPVVRRVVCAVDCGTAVAPDQIAAQMEGGVAYGLSAALYGAVTLKDGVVEQTNFDTYRVLRFNEAPVVETHILASTAAPSGVGEPGTPPIAPAVANAVLALTGRASLSLPFVKA